MCYTPTSSAVSFLASLAGSAILSRYSPALAIFFVFVSLMQIYDYIFWHNQKRTPLNYTLTRVAMITNHLQPLVLAAAIALLDVRALGPISRIVVPIYAIAALIYTINTWFKIDYTLVTKRSHGSLYWAWNYQTGSMLFYTLFLATLCILAYEHYRPPINWALMAIFSLSLLFTTVYFKGWTSGRFWCWIAGFLPFIIVGLYMGVKDIKI